jgi:hypothetical protein
MTGQARIRSGNLRDRGGRYRPIAGSTMLLIAFWLAAMLVAISGCTHQRGPVPLPRVPGWAYHPRPVVCSTSGALVFKIEPSATALDHDVYGCVLPTTSPRQPIDIQCLSLQDGRRYTTACQYSASFARPAPRVRQMGLHRCFRRGEHHKDSVRYSSGCLVRSTHQW